VGSTACLDTIVIQLFAFIVKVRTGRRVIGRSTQTSTDNTEIVVAMAPVGRGAWFRARETAQAQKAEHQLQKSVPVFTD
jgi:hypothetical protein